MKKYFLVILLAFIFPVTLGVEIPTFAPQETVALVFSSNEWKKLAIRQNREQMVSGLQFIIKTNKNQLLMKIWKILRIFLTDFSGLLLFSCKISLTYKIPTNSLAFWTAP